MTHFNLKSRRVLTPKGERPATILVRDGRIEDVVGHDATPEGPTEDWGDALVMPGVVDTHVHINEPGRTEWEGFASATRAAAAGGITTVVDMPLNSTPVTTTLAALQAKHAETPGKLWVDVGFWGGVVPGNAAELEPMIRAGVCGFKAFLCHSGIDDFPMSTEADLREAMPILARSGIPLLVHAELEPRGWVPPTGDPRRYATFLASRPPEWEVSAIRMMIKLCRETGCPVHVVHLAAADALPYIADAKAEGLPFTVETCPHYLVFAAEDIPDGATHFKCCPPIRDRENRDRLWDGLARGIIDFVACDHSPCTPDLKRQEEGDFMAAWGGIAGLQFSLNNVWTHAQMHGYRPADLVPWLCDRTAAFAGLAHRKGALAPGMDADMVAWYPGQPFRVTSAQVQHRHALTPYMDRQLMGVVAATYLRGVKVFDRGTLSDQPTGEMLARGHAQIPFVHRSTLDQRKTQP